MLCDWNQEAQQQLPSFPIPDILVNIYYIQSVLSGRPSILRLSSFFVILFSPMCTILFSCCSFLWYSFNLSDVLEDRYYVSTLFVKQFDWLHAYQERHSGRTHSFSRSTQCETQQFPRWVWNVLKILTTKDYIYKKAVQFLHCILKSFSVFQVSFPSIIWTNYESDWAVLWNWRR